MQALWMVLGAFFFATMGVGVKLASASFNTFELVFYRGLISIAFMAVVLRTGGVSLRTPVPFMHAWRTLVGGAALTAWFYAIAHLPLATAMTLNYMSGIWVAAFIIGGVLGFALLLTRVTMLESGMFGRVREEGVRRGDLTMLFLSPPRLFRLVRCVLIGLPIWFVVGILVTGAPEFARAFHVTGEVTGASAVQWTYLGLVMGDLGSGALSQWVGSRRKVVLWFLVLTTGLVVAYLSQSGGSSTQLYALCSAMGFGIGYWAVFVTIAAEQFGTNLRATVTTSVPNFVRGSVPLLTAAFIGLKGHGMSLVGSATVVGGACLTLALASLWWMEETYGRELDYLE